MRSGTDSDVGVMARQGAKRRDRHDPRGLGHGLVGIVSQIAASSPVATDALPYRLTGLRRRRDAHQVDRAGLLLPHRYPAARLAQATAAALLLATSGCRWDRDRPHRHMGRGGHA